MIQDHYFIWRLSVATVLSAFLLCYRRPSVWNYAPNDAVSHHRRENFETSERNACCVGKFLQVNKCHILCYACLLYVQYSTGRPLLSRCWILNFVISRNSGGFTVRTSLILTLSSWFCTVLEGGYRDGTS